MQIQVLPDSKSLALAAARLIVQKAGDAVSRSGRFCWVLSGGSTPLAVFRLLAAPPLTDQMPWDATHVFWGDERLLPASHEDSNQGQAYRQLLGKVGLPKANIHPWPMDQEDPARAATLYQNQITSFFGDRPPHWDLLMLGLGSDGHVASLPPDSPLLHLTDGLTGVVEAWETASPPVKRMTLLLPAINLASTIVFLVAGGHKAGIANKAQALMRTNGRDFSHPASLVKPQGEVIWLLDRAAAGFRDKRGAIDVR